MSAGSVSNIPAQKLQPGLCVNLCIQVLCVKSFHTTRPNSGSVGKLWCFIQNLSCSIIHPSFLSLSLQYFRPLFELLFPLQMKLFLFWLFVALPNSSSCVSAGGIFFQISFYVLHYKKIDKPTISLATNHMQCFITLLCISPCVGIQTIIQELIYI